MERIISVAILYESLIISRPPPARHHDLISLMSRLNPLVALTGQQGFLTSDGRFLDRIEAKIFVKLVQQPHRNSPSPELFSEDLW